MMQSNIRLFAITATAVFAVLATSASASRYRPELQRNPLRVSRISFVFGPNFVGNPLIKRVVRVTNTAASAVSLNPAIVGNSNFTLALGLDDLCGLIVAPGASCDVAVQFLPQAVDTRRHSAILSLGPRLPGDSAGLVLLEGESQVLSPGKISSTPNPQVAQYTWTLPYKASWSVRFGTTTEYGRSTSVQTAPTVDTASSMYVAGMLPNTTYHMQATVTLPDGATANDIDQVFTTGALLAGIPATLPATTSAGMTPQPGVELLNTLVGALPTTALVTDLQGNVIWSYSFPDRTAPAELYPVRLLPNGHFLCMIAPVYPKLPTTGDLNVIREFDLAGNTVQQLSMVDLNNRLAAKGFALPLSAFLLARHRPSA